MESLIARKDGMKTQIINSSSWSIPSQRVLTLLTQRLGWDFFGYSVASMERQLDRVARDMTNGGVGDLATWISCKPHHRSRLVRDALTVNVTDLFRDPEFYADLGQHVLPYFSEIATINIWLAGCSTGEEAYSMVILLAEAGLLQRCNIIATDLDLSTLRQARSGVLKKPLSEEEQQRFTQAGGVGSLESYFSHSYGLAKLKQKLLDRIHFVQHGLPGPFPGPDVHLISCRNVMIYFSEAMKAKTMKGFTESLHPNGYFCLGNKESLSCLSAANNFREVSPHRIYKYASKDI